MNFKFNHRVIVIAFFLFCLLFFHNLNMYCRQIRDTNAECKMEMHKKDLEVFLFFAVLSWCVVIRSKLFLMSSFWKSCESSRNKKRTKPSLYSSSEYLHSVRLMCCVCCMMMVQFIIYLSCFKVLLMMCWIGTVCPFFPFLLLLHDQNLLAGWYCVYFCKGDIYLYIYIWIYMYTDA